MYYQIGEMAQQLKTLAAFPKNLFSSQHHVLSSSEPPKTPTPGDPGDYGLCMCTHIEIKANVLKSLNNFKIHYILKLETKNNNNNMIIYSF